MEGLSMSHVYAYKCLSLKETESAEFDKHYCYVIYLDVQMIAVYIEEPVFVH